MDEIKLANKTNTNLNTNTNTTTNNSFLYSRQDFIRNELLSIDEPQLPTVLVDM
jgi:hypothetical protein